MKRVLFLVCSGLLAALFVVSFGQDTEREWTAYQRKFFKSLHKEERRGMTGGIKQVIIKDLDAVDRCTTCHLAIDKPALALAEEPFTAHPGDFLATHPPEKFGCTVCHGGQGLATEVDDAHGHVKHWEQPLLQGELVQASCAKCHGDLGPIAKEVPQLAVGKQLYTQLGCAGCHAIDGFGQSVSIDLSDIGDKPLELLDFTFVEGGHTLGDWVYEHFVRPRKVTPGFRKEELPAGEEEIYPTFMPDYGLSDEQAMALTIYMLSLTGKPLPSTYVLPPAPAQPEPEYASSVEHGQAVFHQYGCNGCHGANAMGGRKNWNAQLGQEVPSLVYVKAYYDKDTLKEFIRTGRQPAPRLDTRRPRPPLYMPSWKDRVTEEELDALAEYLLSLYEQVPATNAPADTENGA